MADTATDQIGTAPQHWVIANGYLEKGRDGAVRSGWARRFFVLTPTTLFYFRRHPPYSPEAPFGEMRDKVFLQEIHCVRLRSVASEATDSYYHLEVQTLNRLLLLRTPSEALANEWKAVIDSASKMISQGRAAGEKHPKMTKQAVPDAESAGWQLTRQARASMSSMSNPQLLQPFEVTGVRAVGYLDKARDGAVRSGWTTRFFVLTKTHLSYFKRNDPVQELTGEHRRTPETAAPAIAS